MAARDLTQVRQRIDEVKDALEELERAQLTVDEVRARIEERLDAQLDAAPVHLAWHHLVDPSDRSGLRQPVAVRGTPSPYAAVSDGVSLTDLVLLLGRETFVTRLVEQLAPHCGEHTLAERDAERQQLLKELKKLELEDARLVTELFDAGRAVPWRADADVEALLEAWK